MRVFETHFQFTVWIHIHGRNEEDAIENTREYFTEEFVNSISEHLAALVDYKAEVVSEIKNGLFEVELKWTSYWNIDHHTKVHATTLAQELLDIRLTPVFQAIENLADKNAFIHFNGKMTDSIEEVIELKLRNSTPEHENNLKCPSCHTEFYEDFNVYEEYAISCPNSKCSGSEEGCDNNLQFFIPINQKDTVQYGVKFGS